MKTMLLQRKKKLPWLRINLSKADYWLVLVGEVFRVGKFDSTAHKMMVSF